jgi:hypothetical protein
MKDIRLTLKNVWFRQIRDYGRDEDYREITPYWQSRLCINYDAHNEECKNCKHNYCRPVPKSLFAHISLGLAPSSETDKHRTYFIDKISKGYGKFLWGSPHHRCFIIHLMK